MDEEWFLKHYNLLKQQIQRIPKAHEFYSQPEITKNNLMKTFGSKAYTKLQILAGDPPNAIIKPPIPLSTIFNNFGTIIETLNKLPTQADWIHHKMKPSVTGMEHGHHKIKWRSLPSLFLEYAQSNNLFPKAIKIIQDKTPTKDPTFLKVYESINKYNPIRKRHSEEGYKIELRNHLSQFHTVQEEIGPTNIDLLIDNKIAVEIKKNPNKAEYDRLLGQITRHIMHYNHLIILIVNSSSRDNFTQFLKTLDFLTKDKKQNIIVLNK